MESKSQVSAFTVDTNGRLKDQEGKEWIVTYLEPIIEQKYNPNDNVTILKVRYYDQDNRMLPSLSQGDLMYLRKVDKISDWGAIHMIQTKCWNVVCRPNTSNNPGNIILNFNDKSTPAHGMEIPIDSIIGTWELLASSRIHTNNILKM